MNWQPVLGDLVEKLYVSYNSVSSSFCAAGLGEYILFSVCQNGNFWPEVVYLQESPNKPVIPQSFQWVLHNRISWMSVLWIIGLSIPWYSNGNACPLQWTVCSVLMLAAQNESESTRIFCLINQHCLMVWGHVQYWLLGLVTRMQNVQMFAMAGVVCR